MEFGAAEQGIGCPSGQLGKIWVGSDEWERDYEASQGDILEVLQMLGEEKGSNVVGSQNVNLTQISLTH